MVDGGTPTETDGEATAEAGRPGAEGDRYQLIEAIGRGANGVVFLAFDRKLDRRIAIKVIHKELSDTRGRLEREAHALARLRHPNVVAVYDTGLLHDRLFLAMELVDGQSLRGWLAERPRSWREILPVFVAAGQGLSAVHAAGLVHRDFKPDNVLIGKDGSVRVADFGLVVLADDRAIDAGTSSSSALAADLTRTGGILGTPLYMSPEQFAGAAVTARSDQFSFCAALHHALYGEPPFRGTSSDELRDLIARGELREPSRARRVPAWLRAAVRRGLEAQPARRWPSLDALIAELRRDRGRVWRRAALALAAALAAAALAFAFTRRPAPPPCAGAAAQLAGIWDRARSGAVRAAFEATGRGFAGATWERVSARLDSWAADWAAMREDACRATAVRHEQSEALLDLRMGCLDRRRDELRALVDVLAAADPAVVERAVAAASQLEPLASCADRAALEELAPLPTDPAARARVAALSERLDDAVALTRSGKYADAGKRLVAIVAEARQLGHPPLVAAALYHHGVNLGIVARGGAGVDAPLREAALLAGQAHDGRLEGKAWINLAQTTDEQGHAEAAEAFRAAAEVAVARAGDPPDLRSRLLMISGRALRHAGKLDAARQALAQAIALRDDDYILGTIVNDLALVLRDQGKLAEAAVELERARVLYERALSPAHPFIAGVLMNLGNLRTLMGAYPAARAAFQQSLALSERTMGPEHIDVAAALTNLAAVASLERRHAEAEPLARRALAIKERSLGPDHPALETTLESLAVALVGLGRVAEARPIAARVLALVEKGPVPPLRLARALSLSASIDIYEDRAADAGKKVDRALAVLEGAGVPDDRHDLVVMAEVRLAQHRPADALTLAERAGALLDVDPIDRAEIGFLRARSRWELGQDRPGAVAAARALLAGLSGDSSRELASAIATWLKSR